MASWVQCKCGESIYTNLFSGAGVYRLVLDSDYDAFERPADDDAFSLLFRSGREVLRCKACGRLIVFWDSSAHGTPTYYSEEKCQVDIPDTTQPGASPNGGPATPPGGSGVAEGPPS